jgi:hypothetical protein
MYKLHRFWQPIQKIEQRNDLISLQLQLSNHKEGIIVKQVTIVNIQNEFKRTVGVGSNLLA